MFLNQFSVKIQGGVEKTSGYVEIVHGKQYSINLHNYRSVDCDAHVYVDGKNVGIFRIPAQGSINLERPSTDTGHFTFYRMGSKEANLSDGNRIPEDLRGLIKVVFIPEKVWHTDPVFNDLPIYAPNDPAVTYYSDNPRGTANIDFVYDVNSCSTTRSASATFTNTSGCGGGTTSCASYSPGCTGLSGESNQRFYQAPEINEDLTQKTTIYLRLVEYKSNNIRPLKPVTNSTLFPPPVRR